MAVATRKKLLYGLVAVFLFTACSLTSIFSGDEQPDEAAPTLISSPTPNLTVTAVFAQATADAAMEADPTDSGEADVDAPTETPEAAPTEAATAAPTVPAYAETPAAAVVGGVEAYYLDDAPTIDGDITDWAGEMYAITDVVYGSEFYANAADLSGQFKVAWDSSYLYLGVVVFDTRFSQTATGSQLYLGDSLEILLDTDLAGDADQTELSSDDFQIGISPGNLNDVAIPEAYLWYPSERMSSLTSVQIAGMLTNDGYVVELALPWAEVGVAPVDSLNLGFLLSISDNDMENMNAQQSVVSFSALRELQNPTSWSELLLVNP
jgi:hypothetical protein